MASHMTHSASGLDFGQALDPLQASPWTVLKNFLCVFRKKEGLFAEYLTFSYIGRSRVYCGGRVILGPRQRTHVSVTLSLTIIPSAYFLFSVLPEYEGYPKQHSSLFWLSVVLLVVILIAIFTCSFSNPGIVPRHLRPTPSDFPPGFDQVSDEGRNFHRQSRYYMLHGVVLKQKYCDSCKIYRPPRSKHCAMCDNCVLRFDHHCTILGTCVGLHNYRWFLVLIYAALSLVTIAMSVGISVLSAAIHRESSGPIETIEILARRIVLTLFCAFCIVLFLAVLLLGTYHAMITRYNLTTNEHVKNYYKVNPFDFGAAKNCSHTCLYPEALVIEPTQIGDPGYVRLGSTNSECLSFDDV